MKKSGESADFDFPTKIFKATMLNVEALSYQVYGLHKYTVDGT